MPPLFCRSIMMRYIKKKGGGKVMTCWTKVKFIP